MERFVYNLYKLIFRNSLSKCVREGVWEGRFYWIWLKKPQFFKYKNGGVVPKNVTV